MADNLESISYINLGNGNHPIDAVTVGGKTVPDVSQFITKSVNDLTNYYLKSETYTQEEVNALIGNILQFHYEIAANLNNVSSPANNVLYLIGPTGQGDDKYEEYVYPDSTKGWTKIGDTSIDLSGYVTTQALNTELANYTTSADLTTLLAGKVSTDTLTEHTGNATIHVTSAEKATWNNKQDALTYDSVPTQDSNNLVKSGALYQVMAENEVVTAAALNNLNNRLSTLESGVGSLSIDSTPTEDSDNLVTSGGVYEAIVENELVVTETINQLADATAEIAETLMEVQDTQNEFRNEYDDDQEVIATALDDLNERLVGVESGLVADSVPTVNSSKFVTSGGVYKAIVDNELVIATALNDLDTRLSSVESADSIPTENSEKYVTSGGVYQAMIENEYTVSTAINELNERLTDVEALGEYAVTNILFDGVNISISNGTAYINAGMNDFLTKTEYQDDEEVVAGAINELNTKLSSTIYRAEYDEDQFVIVNAITELNDAVVNMPTTLDDIDDGNLRKLSDYVLTSSYESDERVIAAAFNDLDTRVNDLVANAVTTSNLSNYVDLSSYEDDEEVIAAALNDLDNRITFIEDGPEYVSVSTYEDDELVIAETFNDLNSRVFTLESSTANMITGILVNGVSASISNGIASISVSGGGAGTLTGVTFNGTAASISNGIASISETDPVFSASAAASISTSDITKWDNGSVYFVQGSSSAAGNSTSGSYLATKWEGTVPGYTTPVNGLKIAYRIAGNTGVTTGGVVLSIDGTNYYPVVLNYNTKVTTHYPVGSTILLVFNDTLSISNVYLTSNTKSTVVGCWQIADYTVSNSDTKVYQYGDSGTITADKYPILTRYNTTAVNASGYVSGYTRFITSATVDVSTGSIEATAFVKTSGTSSQFLKADGTVDSNTYLSTSDVNSWARTVNGYYLLNGGAMADDPHIDDINGDKAIPTWHRINSEGFITSESITTTAPSSGSTDSNIPTSKAVNTAITTALTSVLKYKGTATNNASLPATHAVGDVYVVSTAGTFAGKACEVGDYIICKTSGTSANNAHWDVINGENQVENKSASLASANSSVTIATVDGTDITIATPASWTGVDKTGTITGISMNGASKGTSGNVDLGTVITTVSFNGTAVTVNSGAISISESDPIFSASAAAGISAADITNWNGKTSNTGTITGISMNGSSKGTSGNVNLGTVVTSISMNNSAVSISNGVANLGTVITSHQSIKTINSQAVTGTGNLTIREMPSVSSADNGKVLQVVSGAWALVSPATIISGSGTPSNSTGNDGDLYLQTS